jgi:hypothetical protein
MARVWLEMKWGTGTVGQLVFQLEHPKSPGGEVDDWTFQGPDASRARATFKAHLKLHETNPAGFKVVGGHYQPENALTSIDTLLQVLNALVADPASGFTYSITEYPDSLRAGRGGGDA